MIRKLFRQLFRLFIIELTISIKLFIQPFPIVCRMILLVVENSLTVNLVVMKVAFVICAVVVDQLAVALLEAVLAHALVSDAVLVLFLEVDEIG